MPLPGQELRAYAHARLVEEVARAVWPLVLGWGEALSSEEKREYYEGVYHHAVGLMEAARAAEVYAEKLSASKARSADMVAARAGLTIRRYLGRVLDEILADPPEGGGGWLLIAGCAALALTALGCALAARGVRS
jgi:hypothetical protein